MIASSRVPSGRRAEQHLHRRNPGKIEAPNATRAPDSDGHGGAGGWLREKLAVTAARISTASRPSRKTIIDELKTTVVWLISPRVASDGSAGPVSAVAIR